MGAVPKSHLPNTIDTRQTMTSKISLGADHIMKMPSIELVEGAAQETEEGVRILRPVGIEPTVTKRI